MYVSVKSHYKFRQLFHDAGRQHQFSNYGLEHLYQYLEDCDYGEVDVIDLCCTFTEISREAALAEFGVEEGADEEETHELLTEAISRRTALVYTDEDNVMYEKY